jgi:hypothetical protein
MSCPSKDGGNKYERCQKAHELLIISAKNNEHNAMGPLITLRTKTLNNLKKITLRKVLALIVFFTTCTICYAQLLSEKNLIGKWTVTKVTSSFDDMNLPESAMKDVIDMKKALHNSIFEFKQNGQFFIEQGDIVVQFDTGHGYNKYSKYCQYREGLALVEKEGVGQGFINTKQEEVIPLVKGRNFFLGGYPIHGGFSDGLAPFKKEGENGTFYIDVNGKVVLHVPFDLAYYFSEGIAKVWSSKKKRFGYINKKGELVVPFKYTYGTAFVNGLAKVKKTRKGNLLTINTKGEIVD